MPIIGPEDEGLTLGIAPRLRLPVPGALSPQTRRFIQRRRGPASDRYLYLELSHRELAPFGTRALMRGFVLLGRCRGASSALVPVTAGRVLRQVVQQNFAGGPDAALVLTRLHRLVQQRGAIACGMPMLKARLARS